MKLRITPFLNEVPQDGNSSVFEAGIRVSAVSEDSEYNNDLLAYETFVIFKDVLAAETDDRFEVDFKDFLVNVGWEGDFDFLLSAIRNGFPAFGRIAQGCSFPENGESPAG